MDLLSFYYTSVISIGIVVECLTGTIYPVVMIDSDDEWRNSKNDSAVIKSIAIRDAECLIQKIYAYAQHPHKMDEYYIKQDALTLLELSKYINDEDIEKSANSILTALDELNK